MFAFARLLRRGSGRGRWAPRAQPPPLSTPEAQVVSSLDHPTTPPPTSASVSSSASASATYGKDLRAKSATAAPRRLPARPVVLDDLEASVQLAPMETIRGSDLWTATKVLSRSKHVRQTSQACVVGGATAIQRIWRRYRVRPTVVYVPNTEAAVPPWCLEEDLPTVVVRCSPVMVRRQLLSAEYGDGYAAEFPLFPSPIAPATDLLAAAPPPSLELPPLHRRRSSDPAQAMLVLVGLRVPSNVGTLLRAAVDMGYDAALLVNCADPLQEKVLRASDGAALSPQLRMYETATTAQDCVSLLSAIAAQHRLLPLLAVPSQDVDSAFEVAKRFHQHNRTNQEAAGKSLLPPLPSGFAASPLGPMVVLGSEAHGLRDLDGNWGVPYQLVTLPLPNTMINSYNVAVAGSVLLRLFRPKAAAHFETLAAIAGEEPSAERLSPPATSADASSPSSPLQP